MATRAAKLLGHPRLAALFKYHVRNATPEYSAWYEPGARAAAFLAPAYVLIRDHARFECRRLRLGEMEDRDGTLVVRGQLNGRPVELLGENLADLLERGEAHVAIAAQDGLLGTYTRPAGLFNYYEERGEFCLHFHPDFGRGEHTEFFNFWQKNLYGVFTPDSFIEINPIDRESSREIYRELHEARVLNARGHLRGPDLLEAHEFRLELARRNAPALRAFLSRRPRRQQAEAEFAALLARVPEIVERELHALGLMESPDDNARAYLTALSDDHLRVLGQLFVERVAAAEIAEQIRKNRGIVLKDGPGNVLLLLSDGVAGSSPYYRQLVGFGQGLAEDRAVHIACAYRTPVPRSGHAVHHPLVEAIRDFEKLRAVDGLGDGF